MKIENSANSLLTLWNTGKPLAEGIWLFTNKAMLKEHKLSKANYERVSKRILLPPVNVEITTSIANLISNSAEAKKFQKQSEKILTELKRDLLKRINAGKVSALGFEGAIKLEGQPVIIPPHIWPTGIDSINWHENSFSYSGKDFSKIRLIKALKEIPPSPAQKLSIQNAKIETKKAGRPSNKHSILRAYEILRASNLIDYSKPLKSHVLLIRQQVFDLNPELKGNDKGLGYEVIRRTLGPMFALKS